MRATHPRTQSSTMHSHISIFHTIRQRGGQVGREATRRVLSPAWALGGTCESPQGQVLSFVLPRL